MGGQRNLKREKRATMITDQEDSERLLTPGEAAARFRVGPKTVNRWADRGLLGVIRLPGGHRRYRESEVDRVIKKGEQ
jgi:excisionase family DNA binding protein